MLRKLAPLGLTLALAACVTPPPQKPDTGYRWPYPEKPAAPAADDAPQTSAIDTGDSAGTPTALVSAPGQPLPDFPRSAEQVSGTAVAALIRQARAARESRQPEQAQARLERALKIEPRNYFAWSALAATYLDQKNYEQAAGVAAKSNSLARGNPYVELDNYRVIQEARLALGQSDASFQAKARADEIQQRLQPAP